MTRVDTLLRRLARYQKLRSSRAPSVLLAVESALIRRSLARLSVDELLQVSEKFA